jgi:hypothetical protein
MHPLRPALISHTRSLLLRHHSAVFDRKTGIPKLTIQIFELRKVVGEPLGDE